MDKRIVPVRNQVAPAGAIRRLVDGRLHEAKIERLPIGADDEPIAQVLDLVFVIGFVRQKDLERQRGIAGLRVPPLRGHGAFHVDENEALRLRLDDAGVEAPIGLGEHPRIRVGLVPPTMLLDVQPKQGLGILLDIEHGGVVVGPRDVRLDVVYRVGEDFAALQIFEAQAVLAPADRVLAEGEPPRVGRHLDGVQPIVLKSCRAFVRVQDDLLGRIL